MPPKSLWDPTETRYEISFKYCLDYFKSSCHDYMKSMLSILYSTRLY